MSKTFMSYFPFTRFTVDVQNRDSCEYIMRSFLTFLFVVVRDYLHRLYLNVCSHQSGKRGQWRTSTNSAALSWLMPATSQVRKRCVGIFFCKLPSYFSLFGF